jgi:hypothetical protein
MSEADAHLLADGNAVVIPGTGEVVPLDAPLDLFVGAWEHMQELDADLKSARRALSDEIARRLDHEGRRSLAVGRVKFEVNAPTEKQWDLKELQETLAELLAEDTISQAKAESCIRWEPKAVWMELKTLLSDPRCAARIEHCYRDAPATRYAKVRHA